MTFELHHGDCLEVLRGMAEASVDAVVCDPPYELGFMAKSWDRRGIAFDPKTWAEVFRVLKPGGHLLAFGGTRTYHRMACAIEDAGFEIRDTIGHAFSAAHLAWVYSTGFPKSLQVGKNERFCQCVRDMRPSSAEDASVAGKEVLQPQVCQRRSGAVQRQDLRSLRQEVDGNDTLPGGAEQDVLGSVFGQADQSSESRTQEGASNDLPSLRQGVLARGPEVSEALQPGVLLESKENGAQVPQAHSCCGSGVQKELVETATPGVSQAHDGVEKPELERRSDVSPSERQLRRGQVRSVPGAIQGDGADGRLRHGTSSRCSEAVGTTVEADGSGTPRRPQPAQQRSVEPRAVSNEQSAQAGRAWPTCSTCGRPVVPAGLGTALKPSFEPIVLARKPLDGTVAANVLAHGTGALNIDGCRVDGVKPEMGPRTDTIVAATAMAGASTGHTTTGGVTTHGRWPPNLVLSHSPECRCVGTKRVAGSNCRPEHIGLGRGVKYTHGIYGAKASKIGVSHVDSNGTEAVDAWECVEGCPVKELDRQSGITESKVFHERHDAYVGESVTGFLRGDTTPQNQHPDEGGASRFFPTFAWEASEVAPFRYCAKAARSERDSGLDHLPAKTGGQATDRTDGTAGLNSPRAGAGRTGGVRNVHPTVKPIELMGWLCRLVTPPGGTVLDPFMGSGTTGVAALREGFRFVGIEREEEYLTIARARIEEDAPLFRRPRPAAARATKDKQVEQVDLFAGVNDGTGKQAETEGPDSRRDAGGAGGPSEAERLELESPATRTDGEPGGVAAEARPGAAGDRARGRKREGESLRADQRRAHVEGARRAEGEAHSRPEPRRGSGPDGEAHLGGDD